MLDLRRAPHARECTALHALLVIAVTSAAATLLGWLFGARTPLVLCAGVVVGCGIGAHAVRTRDVGLVLLVGPAAGFSVVAIPLLAMAPGALSADRSEIDKILQTYDYGVPSMIVGAFVALLVAGWRHRSRSDRP